MVFQGFESFRVLRVLVLFLIRRDCNNNLFFIYFSRVLTFKVV